MSIERRRAQPALLARSSAGAGDHQRLEDLELPLELDRLIPGRRFWELEVGFGKGRYILRRAQQEPEGGFVGIELVAHYFRLAAQRAHRRGLGNVLLLRGEALYLLQISLPSGFARALHVYFPDPWPKSRHHKRRLFEAENLDLLLRPLAPSGTLCFATDHLPYGELVEQLLRSHPRLRVKRRRRWPDGPRTNYEAKYLAARRPVLRLEARLLDATEPLVHPQGTGALKVGPRQWV